MKNFYLLSLTLSGASLFSFQVQAQENENIYELLTTAIHQRESKTALPVTVVTGDDLQKYSGATLGETLATQPGINNASFGPAVGQTVIRGQQGRRVLTMNNGIASADASGNSADHANAIEPILAQSIEVLRGPSTLLYGGGAIGGVVNVIDSRIAQQEPDSPSFIVESRHDSSSDQNVLVSKADFVINNIVWHIDGVKRVWNPIDIPNLAISPPYLSSATTANSDGFITNSQGEMQTITLGASYILDNGFLGLSASTLDNIYGLPPGVEEENVAIDMKRNRYDFIGEWRNLASWIESLNYKVTYTNYVHKEVEESGDIGTTFSNDSWQQRLQVVHPEFNGWHGVLGLQTSDETFGAIGDESFIPVTDITARGLFWVEDFHTQNLTFELGARINHDQYSPISTSSFIEKRSFTTNSLSVSALWDINAPLTIGLSVSRSQRAPSIEEIYSNIGLNIINDCVIHLATAACEIGNAYLNKETSINTDLTFAFDFGNQQATVSIFHNSFNDYIFQQNTGLSISDFSVQQYTQSDTNFAGIEAQYSISFLNNWELKFFGDTINSQINNSGHVPRMPPTRVGAELNLNVDKLSAFASLIKANDANNPGQNELSTKGYTRVDIGVNYLFELNGDELLLFAKGKNITNEEIRLSTSFLRGFAPESARSIEVGIRYSLN